MIRRPQAVIRHRFRRATARVTSSPGWFQFSNPFQMHSKIALTFPDARATDQFTTSSRDEFSSDPYMSHAMSAQRKLSRPTPR